MNKEIVPIFNLYHYGVIKLHGFEWDAGGYSLSVVDGTIHILPHGIGDEWCYISECGTLFIPTEYLKAAQIGQSARQKKMNDRYILMPSPSKGDIHPNMAKTAKGIGCWLDFYFGAGTSWQSVCAFRNQLVMDKQGEKVDLCDHYEWRVAERLVKSLMSYLMILNYPG